jgi:hypothetical protein
MVYDMKMLGNARGNDACGRSCAANVLLWARDDSTLLVWHVIGRDIWVVLEVVLGWIRGELTSDLSHRSKEATSQP